MNKTKALLFLFLAWWAAPASAADSFGAVAGSSITVKTSATMNFGGKSQITVSCWIKPTSVGGNKAIAGARTACGGSYCWQLYLSLNPGAGQIPSNRTGPVFMFLDSGGALHTDPALSSATANAWNFVAGTYDGTTLRTYLNGVAVSTGVLITATINSATNPNTYIGQESCGAVNSYPGSIDDFREYARALSATEIANLYTSWMRLVTTDIESTNKMVLWLPMDEATFGKSITGTTLFDRSGNGNNGFAGNASLAGDQTALRYQ